MAPSAKYLLNASALYPLMLRMRENILRYGAQFAVLDLTLYEVGNAIGRRVNNGNTPLGNPRPSGWEGC